MRWDDYGIKTHPFHIDSRQPEELNRASLERWKNSDYIIPEVLTETPYYFFRYLNGIGPGSLGKVLDRETIKALNRLNDHDTGKMLTGYLKEAIGDAGTIVMSFLSRNLETSCHLRILDGLLSRIGRTVSFCFENLYRDGIKRRQLMELGIMLGAGCLWRHPHPRHLGFPIYCLSGDNASWITDQQKKYNIEKWEVDEVLKFAEEDIHHIMSDKKEAESMIAAIQQVIHKKISEQILFDYKGIHRNHASNKSWVLAQSLYVRAMKSVQLKHKNLHVSKCPSIVQQVDKLLEEVSSLYNYFMRDYKVYLPVEEHYTIEHVKTTKKETVKVYEMYQPEPYYESVEPRPFSYSKHTVNQEKLKLWHKCRKYDMNFTQYLDLARKMKNDLLEPFKYSLYEDFYFTYADPANRSLSIMTRSGGEDVALDFFNQLPQMLDPPEAVPNLERYVGLSSSEITTLLKSERMSSNQIKKMISKIRAALEEGGHGKPAKLVIPPPRRRETEEVIERECWGIKRIPVPAIESEQKHSDFKLHIYRPNKKVVLRNAKRTISKEVKKIEAPFYKGFVSGTKEQRRQKHLTDSCRSASKAIHNTRSRGGDVLPQQTQRKKLADENLLLYFEEYRFTKFRLESKKEVDFNVYDFREINRIKQLILVGEMIWSRGWGTKSRQVQLERGLFEKVKKEPKMKGSTKYKGLMENMTRFLAQG